MTEDKLGIAETVDLVEGGADITVDKNNLPAYLEAQLRYRLMNRIVFIQYLVLCFKFVGLIYLNNMSYNIHALIMY